MLFTLENSRLGSELTPEDQKQALARFVHRYTGEHLPDWARNEVNRPPVQFVDDKDWLAHTRFAVTRSGRLSESAHQCQSEPTWPHNPELRN